MKEEGRRKNSRQKPYQRVGNSLRRSSSVFGAATILQGDCSPAQGHCEAIVCKETEPPTEELILCRAAVQVSPTATGELMFMPAGIQEITPAGGGIGKPIKVLVDASGAAALEEQRQKLVNRGKRPYFDFNHEDGPASFWPEEFAWQPQGIFCKGEWTRRGKDAVEGKEYRQFSPVFYVDNKRGDPARLISNPSAKPNMGGLVNDAAFHNILPFWAKDAGATGAQANRRDSQRRSLYQRNRHFLGSSLRVGVPTGQAIFFPAPSTCPRDLE